MVISSLWTPFDAVFATRSSTSRGKWIDSPVEASETATGTEQKRKKRNWRTVQTSAMLGWFINKKSLDDYLVANKLVRLTFSSIAFSSATSHDHDGLDMLGWRVVLWPRARSIFGGGSCWPNWQDPAGSILFFNLVSFHPKPSCSSDILGVHDKPSPFCQFWNARACASQNSPLLHLRLKWKRALIRTIWSVSIGSFESFSSSLTRLVLFFIKDFRRRK